MVSSVSLGYPLWTDGMTWTSLLQRQLDGGVAVWDANASATAVSPRGGVIPGPANPLAVAPLATPAMSVLVNAGYCAVPHPTAQHGVYLFGLKTQGTLTVAANGTGSIRIDIVVARVNDLGNSSSTCDVELVAGTAGSGQPATPSAALLLGAISVAPAAVSITAANITDKRIFTVAPGGVLPSTVAAAPPLTSGQIMLNTSTGALETLGQPVTYAQSFSTTTSWVSPFTGLLWASGIGGSGGGGGGYQDHNDQFGTTSGGGGSGGGEWAGDWIPVTKGVSYPVTIGQGGFRGEGGTNATSSPHFGAAGGDATATTFVGDGAATLTCNGGKGGEGAGQQFPATGGLGGTGSTNAQHHPGGAGGAGGWDSASAGGGGGGSGSPGAPGGAGQNANRDQPGNGGAAGPGGGPGGLGGEYYTDGAVGTAPGGGSGGGGAEDTTYWQAGGNGNPGSLILTWTLQPAPLTPVKTTISSDTSTPGEYLTAANTDTSTFFAYAGPTSAYGWGLGFGYTDGSYNADNYTLADLKVTFTADGITDYQIDVKWGLVVPEAAVDTASPSIPYGRCRIQVVLDSTVLDSVWLNCAAQAGVLYPGDAGSFTVYTSSQRGTTPTAGPHTVSLTVDPSNTRSGSYSGLHVGDLGSVGTSPNPFGGALPAPYTTALTQENCYLRVAGISAGAI